MCTRVGNTNQFGGGMWMVYCPFCSAPLSSTGLRYDADAAIDADVDAFIKSREGQLDWLDDVVAVKDDGSPVVRGYYDDYGNVIDSFSLGGATGGLEEVEIDRDGGAKAEGVHYKCWEAMGKPTSLAPHPGLSMGLPYHPNLHLSVYLQSRYGITFDLNELHGQFLKTTKLDVDKNAWMLLDPSIPGTKNHERFASIVQWIKKQSLKKKSSLYSQPTASLPAATKPRIQLKKIKIPLKSVNLKAKKATASVKPKPTPRGPRTPPTPWGPRTPPTPRGPRTPPTPVYASISPVQYMPQYPQSPKIPKFHRTPPGPRTPLASKPKPKAKVKKSTATVSGGKPCNQKSPKASDPEYVCNPETGRWVKRNGTVAKKLGL